LGSSWAIQTHYFPHHRIWRACRLLGCLLCLSDQHGRKLLCALYIYRQADRQLASRPNPPRSTLAICIVSTCSPRIDAKPVNLPAGWHLATQAGLGGSDVSCRPGADAEARAGAGTTAAVLIAAPPEGAGSALPPWRRPSDSVLSSLCLVAMAQRPILWMRARARDTALLHGPNASIGTPCWSRFPVRDVRAPSVPQQTRSAAPV